MQSLQDLAFFFLICQVLSGLMLVLGVQFDETTFKKAGIEKHRTRPALIKSAKLFSSTIKPVYMAIYLLSLIFVVFSYAALLMLVGQFVLFLIN